MNKGLLIILFILYLAIALFISYLAINKAIGWKNAFWFSIFFTPFVALFFVLISQNKIKYIGIEKAKVYKCHKCGYEYLQPFDKCQICNTINLHNHNHNHNHIHNHNHNHKNNILINKIQAI